MSPLARLNRLSSRVEFSSPALALSLVAILLISAPRIAAGGPPPGGRFVGTLSVGDISIVEGDTQVQVPVTFTGNAPTFEFTITAFTGPGDTATDGADFTGRTTTRTGTGLPETINFNVQIKDDTEVEGNETFTVKITGVAGAGAGDVTIGDDTATVTITPDGDIATSNITVSIGDRSANEGDAGTTNFDFTVTRSGDPGAFTVDVATADAGGTQAATAGVDYVAKTQSVSFAANDATKTFRVLVNGDTEDEQDEQFLVKLSNAQGATIGDGQGLGTINDDDGGGGGDDGTGSLVIISPESKSAHFDWSGGFGRIEVSGDLSSWKAVPQDKWIQILSGESGSGGGTVSYIVDSELPGELPDRAGSIDIGGETFSISQGGPRLDTPGCFQELPPLFGSCSLPRTPSFSATLMPRPRQPARPFERAGRNLDGDGLEEIVVAAPELDGAGRGAWVQSYNEKGKRALNFFAGNKFAGLQAVIMDTDGNEKTEPVFVGTETSGAAELQLRGSKGGLQDRKPVSASGSVLTHVVPMEYDGERGVEIGIAYVAKNGTGRFAVWGLEGKKLQRMADERSIIDAKSTNHQWLPVDSDGDGRQEIAATYAAPSGKGSKLRIFDPRTGETLVNKTILRASFDQAGWTLGDFDPKSRGDELLVGYRKKSNGFFKVLAGDGTVLSTSRSISAKPLQAMRPLPSRPGPKGTVRDLVFVGFARPNGDAAFEVWDPSKKKAKRIGGGTVASSDYEVLTWQVGEFDGDADNGAEIVVVTRDLGDRNIGFQMFGQGGKKLGDRVQVFDSSYIAASAIPIVFARKGRDDLALMARTVGGQPEVQVWNVNARTLLKKIAVLSKDVE